MQISLVAAMAHHRVIGYAGTMPWHLPQELAYFKRITTGKPIVMGRKTYESIGKALPHRRNIIISQQNNLYAPNCEVYASLESALNQLQQCEEVMIIGGESLFMQTIAYAQRLYLTLIDAEVQGDTYFPEWDKTAWTVLEQHDYPVGTKNNYAYQTIILEHIDL